MGKAGTRRRPRSARGEGEELRDEILDSAEELLLDAGSMDAVSVRAIADAVGVSPPSLYLHFDDKDDLFFAVCERRFEDFERAMTAAGVGIQDPVERLRALGRAYIRYGVERGEHYELLFGPRMVSVAAGRDLSESASTRAFNLLVDLIAEGVRASRFREVDPHQAAFAVWSSVHGAVMIILAKGGLGDSFPLPAIDALADQICDLVESGLAA
jgi:AcrR family transcriptional regulator